MDENDLCFLGGFPGPLRKVLGIWSEEIDALKDLELNHIIFREDNELSLVGEFEAVELCDLIHSEGSAVLATYKEDFYAGRPAVTVNNFGKGKAYYIASRNKEAFNNVFYNKLIQDLKLKRTINSKLPKGVTAQLRTDGEYDFIFIMNFNNSERKVDLGENKYEDLIAKVELVGEILLDAFGLKILKINRF